MFSLLKNVLTGMQIQFVTNIIKDHVIKKNILRRKPVEAE